MKDSRRKTEQRKRRWWLRNKVLTTLIMLLVPSLLMLVSLSACYMRNTVRGKYEASDHVTIQKMRETPRKPVMQFQEEGHTCGLVSMSMLYDAYGLIPEAHELRFRLGVDEPAVMFVSSTKGVLPHDVFRVLKQDGFEYELVNLEDKDVDAVVWDHFNAGDHALMIYRLSGTDIYHWVLLDGREDDKVRVYDPLKGEWGMKWQALKNEIALSVILVRSAESPGAKHLEMSPFNDANAEVLKIPGRDEDK